MKTDLFPRKCCGATESIEYEFEMTGTIKGLAYVNEGTQRGDVQREQKKNRQKPDYAVSERKRE